MIRTGIDRDIGVGSTISAAQREASTIAARVRIKAPSAPAFAASAIAVQRARSWEVAAAVTTQPPRLRDGGSEDRQTCTRGNQFLRCQAKFSPMRRDPAYDSKCNHWSIESHCRNQKGAFLVANNLGLALNYKRGEWSRLE